MASESYLVPSRRGWSSLEALPRIQRLGRSFNFCSLPGSQALGKVQDPGSLGASASLQPERGAGGRWGRGGDGGFTKTWGRSSACPSPPRSGDGRPPTSQLAPRTKPLWTVPHEVLMVCPSITPGPPVIWWLVNKHLQSRYRPLLGAQSFFWKRQPVTGKNKVEVEVPINSSFLENSLK